MTAGVHVCECGLVCVYMCWRPHVWSCVLAYMCVHVCVLFFMCERVCRCACVGVRVCVHELVVCLRGRRRVGSAYTRSVH